MAKAGGREERESSLASGWTVHADPAAAGDEVAMKAAAGAAAAAAGIAGADPERSDAAAGTDATLEASENDDVSEAGDAGEAAPGQLSNAMLVVLGVVGGLYLLYSWIWLSWTRFYADANAAFTAGSGTLGSSLQQIVLWFAPLAPILWFIAVLTLNRRRAPEQGLKPRAAVVWLVIGAIVLLPLPIFNGMVGA